MQAPNPLEAEDRDLVERMPDVHGARIVPITIYGGRPISHDRQRTIQREMHKVQNDIISSHSSIDDGPDAHRISSCKYCLFQCAEGLFRRSTVSSIASVFGGVKRMQSGADDRR